MTAHPDNPLQLDGLDAAERDAVERTFAAALAAHDGSLDRLLDGADDLHAGIDSQGFAFVHVAGSADSLPRTWRLSSAGQLGEWAQLGPDTWDFRVLSGRCAA